MTSVETLLSQFIAADRAGGDAPDPQAYLDQLQGTDRAELDLLIDEYLARAPRRAFDAQAFAASPARALTDDLIQALDGQAGTWPALLPRLRHRARLSRAQLVTALAQALGVPGKEAAVQAYYHEMEQGTLPAAGVTDRVLEALAALVGSTQQALRAAGEAIVPPPASQAFSAPAPSGAPPARAAFARKAQPDLAFMMEEPPPPPASPGTGSPDTSDVDALFTGRRSDH
jgi:hypothetical protein